MMTHAQESVARYASNGYRVESPFVEYLEYFFLFGLLGHEQHALLRFAEHDFVGRHSTLPLWNVIEVQLHTRAGTRAHLAARTSETGRAHILDADDQSFVHGFETRLEQQLFHKRIADLDVWPLSACIFSETGGGHCCAVNAIASGLCAHIYDGIAEAARASVKDLVFFEDP